MTRAILLVTCAALLAQTFRSEIDAVTISASIKKGNVPIAGLSSDDFRLTDNGVPQRIELLTVVAKVASCQSVLPLLASKVLLAIVTAPPG